MNIALIGYGAMGRQLEALAPSESCSVTSTYDETSPLPDASDFSWDVAIDFSSAATVLRNAEIVSAAGKGLVIGTTGWYEQLPQLQSIIDRAGTGCVFGSNFSVGVQMFYRIARAAGVLVNTLPEYDVAVHEWHHTRKADSPSGTALTLGNILLSEIERKKSLDNETQHERINPTHLHVTSTRVGAVTGKHIIIIDGTDDRIELTHDAHTRAGFARGALKAAHWVKVQRGLFDFTDVFMQVMG